MTFHTVDDKETVSSEIAGETKMEINGKTTTPSTFMKDFNNVGGGGGDLPLLQENERESYDMSSSPGYANMFRMTCDRQPGVTFVGYDLTADGDVNHYNVVFPAEVAEPSESSSDDDGDEDEMCFKCEKNPVFKQEMCEPCYTAWEAKKAAKKKRKAEAAAGKDPKKAKVDSA